MSGWIKAHRSWLEWEWYGDPQVVVLFLHLLLKANYKAASWRGMTLKPGQLVTGRASLSEATGLSEQQIRTSLDKLKSTNDIKIEATNQFSIITLVNWEKYQGDDENATSEQPANQPTSNQPTNQRATTVKEGNKSRNTFPDGNVSKAPDASKGSRLPADWSLPADWKDEALAKTVLNEPTILQEAEIFKNYWIAAAGAKGRKADWRATWRNWIIRKDQDVRNRNQNARANFRQPENPHHAGPKPTGSGFGGRPSQTEIAKQRSEEIIRRRAATATQENPGLPGFTDPAHPSG